MCTWVDPCYGRGSAEPCPAVCRGLLRQLTLHLQPDSTLATVLPYGHVEPHEVSREELESTVSEASYVEEDTLEDFPTEDVVGGLNRELVLVTICSVYQAVPRQEVTGKILSKHMRSQEEGA